MSTSVSTDVQPRSSHTGTAVLLAMTMALGPLALDTYLPAFQQMASSFGVSAHQISLSVSLYVFALAAGQLIAGPLSDRWGRAAVMVAGLCLFSGASYMISQSTSLQGLMLCRMLQALGGGATTVCVPALVRDRLSGSEAARFFSLIGMIMILAPAIAPALGSLILSAFSWPVIFVFLSGYALGLVVLLKWLLFGRLQAPLAEPGGSSIWMRYRSVLSTRPALRYLFLQTFSFAVMLLFITHASYLYQDFFGASESRFALLFAANILFMMAANLVNRRLLRYFSPQQILRWSVSLQAIAVACLLLVSLVHPVLWLFLPFMMMTVGSMGAISPNTLASYMEYFSRNGGTASALLGAAQFSLGGLISGLSTLLPESVPAVVAAQAACAAVCLVLVWQGSLRNQ